MAANSFIVELKRRLPESSWSWVISAFRQDTIVWHAAQGELGKRFLDKYGDRSEAYSPAHLGLLASGCPNPESAIKNKDYTHVIEPAYTASTPNAQKNIIMELVEAVQQAITLLDEPLQRGDWQDPVLNIGSASPTAVACLYGMLASPIDLLAALISAERPDLALHAFLSNPLPSREQVEVLSQLSSRLPLNHSFKLIRLLFPIRPKIAVALAQELLKGEQMEKIADEVDFLLNGSGLHAYYDQINHLLFRAEVFRLAAQPNLAAPVLHEAIQISRNLQAQLASRLAQAASDEDDRKASISAWEQACRLDPDSADHFGGFLVSLLDDSREQQALDEISEHIFPSEFLQDQPAYMSYIRARLAVSAGDRKAARQEGIQSLHDLQEFWETGQKFTPVYRRLPMDLARLFLELSLPQESVDACELILEIDPSNLDGVTHLFKAQLASGQLDAAIQSAHLAVGLAPDRLDIRRQLGTILEAAADWTAAREERIQLMERIAHPTQSDWHDLARCSLHAGMPQETIQICQDLIDKNKDDGIAYALLGEALAVQGDLVSAIEHLNQATQILPGHPAPWLSLTRTYEQSGDHAKAIEVMSSAAQSAPDQPEILLTLGEAYLVDGAPTQALNLLRRAFSLQRENSNAEGTQSLAVRIGLRLGQALQQLGHLAEARDVLEQAYQSSPYQIDIAHKYAQVLMVLDDPAPALAPLQTVLRSNPADLSIYLDYARCVLRLEGAVNPDHYKTALCYIDRVMDLDPGNAEARALSAELLAASGELIPAVSAYRKALDTRLSEDPAWKMRLWFGLGKVALDLDQVETAIAALQEASQAGPPNSAVFRLLCEAYDAAGLVENAYDAAQTTLDLSQEELDSLIWFAQKVEDLQARPGSNIPKAHANAIRALNKASKIVPDQGQHLVRLGYAQVQIGETTAAHETFRRLIGQNQDLPVFNLDATPDDLHQAAMGLMHLGDPAGAVTSLERALQIYVGSAHLPGATQNQTGPSRFTLLSDLVKAYQTSGNNQMALQALEQAIRLAPQQTNLYVNKAEMLMHLAKGEKLADLRSSGRADLALEALETALNIDITNPDQHLRVAIVQRILGDLPSALEHAREALVLFSRSSTISTGSDFSVLSAHLLAADLARAQLQNEEAVLILDSCPTDALSTSPLDVLRHHYLRAELGLDAGDADQAARIMAQSVENSAEDPSLLALQARLRLRDGELPQMRELNSHLSAKEIFLLALERFNKLETATTASEIGRSGFELIDPISAARRRLASAAMELRSWDVGMKLINQTVESIPGEPEGYLSQARALVIRAEHQRICSALNVQAHAPGEEAVSEDSFRSFVFAIQNAEGKILEWAEGLPENCADSRWEAHPFCIVKRWHARGLAVFCPNSQSAEALAVLSPNAENAIAEIACLGAIGDLPACGRVASAYSRNPFILAQLALSLSDKKPRQALTAAQAAVEWLGNPDDLIQREMYAGESIMRKNDMPIVYALLAQLLYQHGNEHEDSSAALQAINKALEIWSTEPHWHVLAAEIYLNGNDPEGRNRAITHLEQSIRLSPDNADAQFKLGQLYLQSGDVQRSLDALSTASTLSPGDMQTWSQLARAYQAAGDPKQAWRCAEKSVELAPGEVLPLLLMGELALENLNYNDAHQQAQLALEIDPTNPQALLLMAKVLKNLNQPAAALDLLENSKEVVESSIPLHIEFIRLVQQTRGTKEALQIAGDLSERYPAEPQVLSQLARLLADDDQIEPAILFAQRALRSSAHPGDISEAEIAYLHYNLGKLLGQAGQLDQAIHHLVEAMRINPNSVEPYLELGRVHQERRQVAQALTAYSQAIAAAPNDARPYYQAGIALKESKDYLEAERMLRRACELAPEDISIHRLLGAVVTLNLVHNRRDSVGRE